MRLSVEMGETGLRVVIEAARPETADLMRRHVEALRLELRQEGLGQVGVSISGGNSQPGREAPHSAGHGPKRRAGAAGPVAPDQAQPSSNIPATRARGAGGSLDLRF